MKKLFLTFSLLVFSGLSFAQSFDKAKLDAYFGTLEKNQKLMGSVALARSGEIFYTKSFGFTDVDNNLKINDKTKFRIGSISKTFTAVLVLKAVEENKLKLSDKLAKFYPKIKNAEKITLEQMLYHRSGIFSLTNDKTYFDWYLSPKSENEIIQKIEGYSSVFEPDTKTEYSNSNYILLSYILEKVYKKSFAKILEEKITKPLGLKNTYLGGKINSKNNEALSYFSEDNQWKTEKESNLSFILGAGAIVSTTEDLLSFHNDLFGGKLLNSKSLEIMKTEKGSMAMGLFTLPFYDKKGLGHTGGIDGFQSVLASFLDEKISYVRLLNGLNFTANDIDIAVLSAVFGKNYEIPDFSKKAVKIESSTIEKFVGTYASGAVPLKIKVFREGEKLMAQATGQMAFPLEATSENTFKFDLAGIIMEFPEDGKMILKQSGGSFHFERE